jgi:phosphoadenosine phosphosulfate reductase
MKLPEIPTNANPQEVLRAGVAAANGPVKLACSFSVEDVVIIDMAKELGLDIGIFALDTGRLNEETYEVADAIVERYRVTIDWFFPRHEAVEKLEREKGLEPLGRALKGLSGWITGLRREQSVTRADLAPVEVDDANGGLLKINPLLEWTSDQVWEYADARRIPVNRLHRQGYPSIGCAPCTRAVVPGEHPRAGRWWWENPEHKECGLHRR